jgi:class 3 adenylate cyclase
MAEGAPGLVTILFTDLVGSTELLARAGDEDAQQIFRAHRRLLTDAVAVHGGHEVKWLGDGLMVAFSSAADAVGCAIEMQQASCRPVEGENLLIRVGLNAGEALRDVDDYFGTPVVVARRLCDRAEGGQILCTETVAGLLAGRMVFTFSQLGKLALKGVPEPVATCEVRYEVTAAREIPARLPMVGRDMEFARVMNRVGEAMAGQGGLVTITGEPGIGKTRMLEEVAEQAAEWGVQVLVGRGFESEWAPPYGPFVEALTAHVAKVDVLELRADLGPGASTVAQLVPTAREILPDLPEPVAVQPDEERFRLIDAVAQFVLARSRRAPVMVCLDDLQWAEKGTVAMLRHLARFASQQRILVIAAYRGEDVGKGHPLTDALQALERETQLDHLRLETLAGEGIRAMLESLAQHDLPPRVAGAWAREVGGNPFFIEEVVRHLYETGDLYRDEHGRWVTTRPIRELTVPEGVQNVVARRLSRLSEAAQTFLGVAAAVEGTFRFDVVAQVAGLDEIDALDALDEAVAARVVHDAGCDQYAFAHALIRHGLYGELTSSRRMRLHRRLAEAFRAAYGERLTPTQAAEIAAQYHKTRALPGVEAGVEFALIAADHAQATGAHDEAAAFLRLGLELLPDDDERGPSLLGRLGIVLAWALAFDEAVSVAQEAGDAIAETEGKAAAARYLSDAAYVCALAGGIVPSWELARTGLTYAGARDIAWARLASFDYQRREAEQPNYPGIPLDTSERAEASRTLRDARLDPVGPAPMECVLASRQDGLQCGNAILHFYWCGEYGPALPILESEADQALARGQLARAARCRAFASMCHAALGNLHEARAALDATQTLAARLGEAVPAALQAREGLAIATDEGLEALLESLAPLTAAVIPPIAWLYGSLYAWAARMTARLGRCDEALRYLDLLAPWLQRAPGWTVGFPVMAAHAAETLWVLDRADHLDVIESALRNKVIGPGFRASGVDGRLAMARLCAVSGRYEEAGSWFAEARRVLTEQGAQPLLAIVDHDEARVLGGRAQPGDTDRATALLDRAVHQFEELGMTGWIQPAHELSKGWLDREVGKRRAGP